jgi:glucose/arabinose dehydrogenase
MRKKLLYGFLALILTLGASAWFLTRPDIAQLTVEQQSGRVPKLGEPRAETFPTINIAEATGWKAGEKPTAPAGFAVSRFAEGLDHPRNMIVLPNGDVLVAETNSPKRENTGVEGMVMRRLMTKAGAASPSANRISLLRDADKDGVAEVKTPLITGLNSPYGMALVGNILFVANTDALVAYPYTLGETKVSGVAEKIVDLPNQKPNNHWTRNIIAAPDGSKIYVAVGSASNIAEHGMAAETCKRKGSAIMEACRAAILEVDVAAKTWVPYVSGARNPVGMDFHPGTGDLWMVVNERDMLGSDMVPDYLARASFGNFYGWPWYYWGGYEDYRISGEAPRDRRQYTRRPEYGLGSHVAPLGLTFAAKSALGDSWKEGAFIALHGSWNRKPASGYSVIYVPFAANGKPAEGKPVTLLSGFLSKDEATAKGRPVDVDVAADGSLLVSDDVGNIIWRVAKTGT